VALAIPLELIVFGTALAGIEERRRAELENAVLVGQALGTVVDSFALSLQSTTQATAQTLGAVPGPLDQSSASQPLQVAAAQFPSLRAMFLTDLQGRTIATGTGGAIGFDLSSRSYIVRLQGGADPIWSGALAGLQTGETTVAFGRVVRGSDGAPRAYLIAAFYPQQFVESLPVSLPADARVTVLDEHGALLYDSDPPGQDEPDVIDSDDVRAALNGQLVRIVGQAAPLAGDARFGVLAPIRRLGWAVSYTRPNATVEAAIATRSWAQAGGIALVVAMATGLVILTARRLTEPLSTLAATADAIASGDRPRIPELHAGEELEQLATAMRVMSSAVADREGDLIAQREWLRVTLASIGDAVVATDADGRVTFMNGPAEKLCGWSEVDALTMPVATILDLRNELTRASIDSPIERVLHEGIVIGLANHTVVVARDGSERPIDDSAAPIRDAQGELIGVVMVFRDVTERRRAEAALRESQQRLELAVEAAPVILFTHDRDLRYTWISKPFPGLSPGVLLGQSDADVFTPDVAQRLTALKREALDTGARIEEAIELPGDPSLPNATARTWVTTVEPLRDASGEIVGLTGAAVDVTEQRALERLQQEFISMVSHELRNPLASVKGYAQLLHRRATYQERAVQAIIRQSDHLDRLISDLLDSSRLQAGRLELRRGQADLVDIAVASVERAQTQSSRHPIQVDVGPGRFVGYWDTERLEQVFNNLLSNAIKYSPEDGEIVLRIARNDVEAIVSIQDQGVGIDAEQLPMLFDRFYRAMSTAGRADGLGVGLFVARELVEAHGGRIWATSDGPGRGSTFSFTLLLESVAEQSPGRVAPILVVDDDGPLRELIVETLQGEGYRVVPAGDGLEAIEQLELELPSLILLDWMMPRMGGEAFAAELRERNLEPAIPVVVMTAGGEARERAASIGAHGFIRKPFELSLLLDQVVRHIQRAETIEQPDA
jgi:PAS domain S-box-containing protein